MSNVSYNLGVERKVSAYAGYIAATAMAALVVLCYHLLLVKLNPTTVALTFLVGVLIVSTNWGLYPAIFMALISTLAFNFFFLPPVGTLTISDPQNWVALGAFLITAVIASELSARARREARSAHERRAEAEKLYKFSQELLSTEKISELLNVTPNYIVESFGVESAAIALTDRPDVYRSSSVIDRLKYHDLQLVGARGEPQINSQEQIAIIPLKMGVRSVGSVGVSGITPSRETLESMASLIAIAVERAGAIEKLSRTEAVRESEHLRSVLLDSVTHEFRTPLTAIKASVTTMLANDHLAEDQRKELLTVIDEESDRLNRLVGEAAEMAQLDANRVELHLGSHPITEAIEDALVRSKQVLQQHPVEVRAAKDLPLVRMDTARISEVLMQLLENAAKYSPAGRAIQITAEARRRVLVTSVADHGPGIDDLEQSLIWEKFYRGRDQRMQVQGTGMGLAISKAIIEAHGGEIGLTSQLGHGSVFHFTLPLA